jgi:DNA-binding XRE family transcriptional regulator
MDSELEQIRKRARVSQEKAAVAAGVTSPTLRIFEKAGPEAIKDIHKRSSLVRVYDGFRDAAAKAA